MSLEDIKITKNDYLSILKNRGITASDNISRNKLLRKVKYLKEHNLKHLATLRNIPILDDMSINDTVNTLYKAYHKKKQDAITEKLERLNLHRLAKWQNISNDHIDEIIRLNKMSLNYLKKIAKLRGINSFSHLRKEDLIYTLLRLGKSLYENNYIKVIKNISDDQIKKKARKIRIKLARLGNTIMKKDRNNLREEELHKILSHNARLTRVQKNRINNHLTDIENILQSQKKNTEPLILTIGITLE